VITVDGTRVETETPAEQTNGHMPSDVRPVLHINSFTCIILQRRRLLREMEA